MQLVWKSHLQNSLDIWKGSFQVKIGEGRDRDTLRLEGKKKKGTPHTHTPKKEPAVPDIQFLPPSSINNKPKDLLDTAYKFNSSY